MAGNFITVAAPARAARAGGVLSVATVRDVGDDSRLGLGGDLQWEGVPCGMPSVAPGLCEPVVTAVDSKSDTADSAYNGVGFVFPGFYGVECFIGPGDDSDAVSQAGLAQGEDRLIEAAIYGQILQDANVITGGVTDMASAIGAAEDYADVNYLGLPVLWMSRRGLEQAAVQGVLVTDPGSGMVFTYAGNPVVASGRIPLTIGVYLTGGVTVQRTPIHTYLGQDLEHNKQMRVAERLYSVQLDCMDAQLFSPAPAEG